MMTIIKVYVDVYIGNSLTVSRQRYEKHRNESKSLFLFLQRKQSDLRS